MPGNPVIVKLNAGYLVATEILLKDCGLPYEDCNKHIDNFIGVFDGKNLVASGAIEDLGEYGLLRSVAVEDRFRGQGLARRIVDKLHQQAVKDGLKALYLLTETAETYFSHYGYRNVDRDALPEVVKSTQQFQSLCPASAQAMLFPLRQDNP